MTITAFSGPVGQFGTVQTSSAGTGIVGQDMEHNEQRAPMFSDLGDAMMDPRVAYSYQPGQGATRPFMSFYNNQATVDYVPATVNSSAFYTSTGLSSAVSGNFTLSSTATGITTTTIIAPETGQVTGSLLAIDSTAAYLTFGSAGSMCVWNPGAGTGRNITFHLSSNTDGGTFSIAGRDMYGFKMTETVAVGSTTVVGKKAFKYISSITNCTTPASTAVSIGFGDVYGFPLAVPYAGLNAQVGLIATTFGSTVPIANSPSSVNTILASTVATQTSTTPDVRGTYASTTASNGTIRLQMIVTPSASATAAITSTNVAPFFGATQFSSV
jgi:hypothetical protein